MTNPQKEKGYLSKQKKEALQIDISRCTLRGAEPFPPPRGADISRIQVRGADNATSPKKEKGYLSEQEKEALWVADDVKEAFALNSVLTLLKDKDPIATVISTATQELTELAYRCIRVKNGNNMQVSRSLCQISRKLREVSISLATALQEYGLSKANKQ